MFFILRPNQCYSCVLIQVNLRFLSEVFILSLIKMSSKIPYSEKSIHEVLK